MAQNEALQEKNNRPAIVRQFYTFQPIAVEIANIK